MYSGYKIKPYVVYAIILVFSILIFAPTCFSQNIPAKKRFTVAFAQDNMANDWRAAQVNQFVQYFQNYPDINFIYTDAEGSTAKQIADIENLMHSNIDVLMTSPGDSFAMTPVISNAYQKGIPVVLVTRTVQNQDYTSFIGPDDEKIGKLAGRFLANHLKGKGQILVLRGLPAATTAIARTKGFLA
ncbi:MAG: substrate-binding domain-containing protein, partial [Gammaproteobacteria bacterium]|nr:substrate-binding domain-containing protein [Gammaproteobacteria bacterium]